MDSEITELDNLMKKEIKIIRDKYSLLKKKIKKKYKDIEKKEKPSIPRIRNSIPKILKVLVWDKYIGKECGISKCLCCKETEIIQSRFDCGHIISVKEGGETNISNLIPICSLCNSSMGTQNLEEFKKIYFRQKQPKFENLVNEYVETKLIDGKTFKSIDTIYSNYLSWLKEKNKENYDTIIMDNALNGGIYGIDNKFKKLSEENELRHYLELKFTKTNKQSNDDILNLINIHIKQDYENLRKSQGYNLSFI
jgi:5-methylcytosine-specific restriction endonuclease McrA